METLHVTVVYQSDDGDFGPKSTFYLEKDFQFKKLPVPGTFIILKDDAIKGFNFSNRKYDPENDIYFITTGTEEGVSRYYHGEPLPIMSEVIERYKKYGWKVTKFKKGRYLKDKRSEEQILKSFQKE